MGADRISKSGGGCVVLFKDSNFKTLEVDQTDLLVSLAQNGREKWRERDREEDSGEVGPNRGSYVKKPVCRVLAGLCQQTSWPALQLLPCAGSSGDPASRWTRPLTEYLQPGRETDWPLRIIPLHTQEAQTSALGRPREAWGGFCWEGDLGLGQGRQEGSGYRPKLTDS